MENIENNESAYEAEIAAMPRHVGWVYCYPSAAQGRDWVIQATDSVVLAVTGSGRVILARSATGELGQEWHDGEFSAPVSGNFGIAFMGDAGSQRFANEIAACQDQPGADPYAGPGLTYREDWQGLRICMARKAIAGNLHAVRKLLGFVELLEAAHQACGGRLPTTTALACKAEREVAAAAAYEVSLAASRAKHEREAARHADYLATLAV